MTRGEAFDVCSGLCRASDSAQGDDAAGLALLAQRSLGVLTQVALVQRERCGRMTSAQLRFRRSHQ